MSYEVVDYEWQLSIGEKVVIPFGEAPHPAYFEAAEVVRKSYVGVGLDQPAIVLLERPVMKAYPVSWSCDPVSRSRDPVTTDVPS